MNAGSLRGQHKPTFTKPASLYPAFAPPYAPMTGFAPGYIYRQDLSTSASGYNTNGEVRATAAFLRAGTLTFFGIKTPAALVGSTLIRAGIYYCPAGVPTDLLADIGTFNGNFNGDAAMRINVPIPFDGWYALACCPQQNGQATNTSVNGFNGGPSQPPGVGRTFAAWSTANGFGWVSSNTAPTSGPLPSSFGTATVTNVAPIVGVGYSE